MDEGTGKAYEAVRIIYWDVEKISFQAFQILYFRLPDHKVRGKKVYKIRYVAQPELDGKPLNHFKF